MYKWDAEKFWMGRTIKVYHRTNRPKTEETCDLGHKHKVEFYFVKRITIYAVKQELIKGLDYIHGDGIGTVLYARDAQGRQYRSKQGWDWAAGRNWLRGITYFSDDKPRPGYYTPRSLDGKLIR
jgi:hypothetical protein